MKKLSLLLPAVCAALSLSAAPVTDSPLWKTWADTPMVREWKELVAKEAWKGNKIGLDHDVPPPWTPMTVKGATVGMWGREWNFADEALPRQIVSQGEELLAAPIRFAVEIDGKWTFSAPGSGKIVSTFPDQVVYEITHNLPLYILLSSEAYPLVTFRCFCRFSIIINFS